MAVLAVVGCASDGASREDGPAPQAASSAPKRTDGGRWVERWGEGTLLTSSWKTGTATSDTQLARAEQIAGETLESIKRYASVAAAERDGYHQMDDIHWIHRGSMLDGSTLDTSKPEGLLYVDDPASGQKALVAAMFVAPAGTHGEQFGGPSTVWHYHDYPNRICLELGMVPVGEPDAEGRCAVGDSLDRSPEMIHVWIDHPGGRFAHEMAAETGQTGSTPPHHSHPS